MKSWSVDEWREYFVSSNSDIFEIIENAIIVAATDCPKEFRVKRDAIAERLFCSRLTRCAGCDRVELAARGVGKESDDEGCKNGVERNAGEFAGASKESKVNEGGDEDAEIDVNGVSNYSFGEAEALTDEMDEETQYMGEVLRIKDVLLNREEESESVLFESLRMLQLMELTVDCLKATEIGKAVNPLRKRGSKEIRQLAKTLIDGWKQMVDEWVKATATTAIADEGTPDSVNPSVVDDEEEEGLPSPPMDEGAFFVAPTGSMELSQFFDGMDDDGNPRPSGPSHKNRLNNGRKPAAIPNREDKSQQAKRNVADVPVRPNKPVSSDSGPGRPLPSNNMQRKSNVEPKMQQKIENNSIPRRHPVGHLDKPMHSDDAAVQAKLEATKRRLQENYQQAEKAKRQRTIQVMEINDLPKHVNYRNPNAKPGFHNRNRANTRR
ncbi:probable mediator of RNA polymerase II transcription subunit 26b isoform X2 [Vigna umbellata]|uniref:probable mediator of RNA polymerase II transcription subunit 26b isoform X2 n=1 Tax=Vigna umbellata TaxID=87088 RepID=UPI001F5EF7C4|nr:probable mediator of RNA polymerase II transcription subunit 26b isoform X2 [Vigna umbellata]